MTHDQVRWATNENGIMLSRTGLADRERLDTVTLLRRVSSLQVRERGVINEKLLDRRFNMTYGTTAYGKRDGTEARRQTQRMVRRRQRR